MVTGKRSEIKRAGGRKVTKKRHKQTLRGNTVIVVVAI